MKDRVKKLLARLAAAQPKAFKTCDAELYDNASDERLTALEAYADELEGQTPPKEEVLTPEEQKAKFLAAAPESIRKIVSDHEAREAAERTGYLSTLKTAQSVYTETELQAKPTDELAKLVKVVTVKRSVDFGGNGAPRVAAGVEPAVPRAKSIDDALKGRSAS